MVRLPTTHLLAEDLGEELELRWVKFQTLVLIFRLLLLNDFQSLFRIELLDWKEREKSPINWDNRQMTAMRIKIKRGTNP